MMCNLKQRHFVPSFFFLSSFSLYTNSIDIYLRRASSSFFFLRQAAPPPSTSNSIYSASNPSRTISEHLKHGTFVPPLTQDDLKKIATYKAVEHVRSGMVIGLGTGSTVKHAVDRIAKLMKQGKLSDVVGITTSTQTYEQAVALSIPLLDRSR